MRIAVDSWTLASRFRCQGTYVYTQNLLREFKKLAAPATPTFASRSSLPVEMAMTLSILLRKSALNFVLQCCSIMIVSGDLVAPVCPLLDPMPM